MLCEDEDWSDAFTSQGTPRGYWKLGESHGTDFPLEPLEGTKPITLILNL